MDEEPKPCSCPVAGWCERHRLEKTEKARQRCITKPSYRQAWDEGRLHGQRGVSFQATEAVKAKVRAREAKGRKAWVAAHACTDPSERWYRRWKRMIPRYGCLCRSKWAALEKKYPPPFGDLPAMLKWFIDRHNDVNVMLGKPIWGESSNPIEKVSTQWE